MHPIVKWAGGKTKLLDAIKPRVPKAMGTYAEPFAGGAALFFALSGETPNRFERALLCDANEELIACYRAVQQDVDAVIRALGQYKYDETLYYRTREQATAKMSDTRRAARFIFLNRTCYNGLWRVNSKGRFNVPFGRYRDPRICDPERLRAASKALAKAKLVTGDFTDVTRKLARGDFVYFDPPYAPASATADFTSYAAGGFGPRDQQRLVDEIGRLRARGVRVLVSNADTPATRALYAGYRLETVHAPRPINSNKKKRGLTAELLVVADVDG
jgi:DNA adenine methylase